MKNICYAACTIVSKNYMAYAQTLADSYLFHNPGHKFFVLLVDRICPEDNFSNERFELISVEDLGILNFDHIAFKFDILELNTNVKPSFLKFLLQKKGIQQLLYLDPDIYFYQSAQPIFDKLNEHEIILTPHCISPINDKLRPAEQDYLKAGVFNLGFIGVNHSEETIRFLNWWEDRCLMLGFNEVRNGIFVDQKWINFVPCFFNSVYILKHPGCNMAYWNLHERQLTLEDGVLKVNETEDLIFFHFSGINIRDNALEISKHQNRFKMNDREDLRSIFLKYKTAVKDHDYERYQLHYKYSFGFFSDGTPISLLVRRLFAEHSNYFSNENPFLADSSFFRWAQKNMLCGKQGQPGNYTSLNYNKQDYRLKIIHKGLKLVLRIIGIERYQLLLQYLSFISILRNQKEVFKIEE